VEAGRKAEEVAREMGVSKHTLYAWRAKYGGLAKDDLKKVKDLEEENRRLKQLVADLSLDREALKWVIEKNGWSSQLNRETVAVMCNEFPTISQRRACELLLIPRAQVAGTRPNRTRSTKR
jgi:putative transposase